MQHRSRQDNVLCCVRTLSPTGKTCADPEGGRVGGRTGPDPLKSIVFSVKKPLDPPVNCKISCTEKNVVHTVFWPSGLDPPPPPP